MSSLIESIVSFFTNNQTTQPTEPLKKARAELTFTLNKALLQSNVGYGVSSVEKEVPFTNGLTCHMIVYPGGYKIESRNYVGVFLATNAPANVSCEFKIKNSSIKYAFTQKYAGASNYGTSKLVAHKDIRSLFVDEKLTITCIADFEVAVPFTSVAPSLFQHCDHVPTDFEIVVGSERLQVHKSVLSLMSPVFHAMLSHNTVEAKLGKVEIADFDFDTVKDAIDCCYGREPVDNSVETNIGILCFADKYNIESVTKQLEGQYRSYFPLDHFFAIVNYAWDYSRQDLKKVCANFYNFYSDKLTKLPEFLDLSSELVYELLKLGHESANV